MKSQGYYVLWIQKEKSWCCVISLFFFLPNSASVLILLQCSTFCFTFGQIFTVSCFLNSHSDFILWQFIHILCNLCQVNYHLTFFVRGKQKIIYLLIFFTYRKLLCSLKNGPAKPLIICCSQLKNHALSSFIGREKLGEGTLWRRQDFPM